MTQNNWRIVLVRPRNPLNIGAAARALANFGFKDLVVVAPYDPVWQEARSAVGADAVVKSARSVRTLLEAVADCTLVVGTTTGSRRNLDRDPVPLIELSLRRPEWSNHPRAALLFGSEKTGLSNGDLSYCHWLVRIPTIASCPSMNLGQAVAVSCYELARAAGFPHAERRTPIRAASSPADLQSIEHVLDRAATVLDQAGYFAPKSRKAQLVKLRRLILGLGLTSSDVRVLGGILAQIEWRMKQK
jgi:TrmH family RNA methyltransferase